MQGQRTTAQTTIQAAIQAATQAATLAATKTATWIGLVVAATLLSAGAASSADTVPPPAAAPATEATPNSAPPTALSPKDAGARYGQALGAVEICFGSKVTDKAKTLGDAFAGADQDSFKAQAGKVFEAWNKVKNCSNPTDPNQCKIIMDKSCASAEAEIGAGGNVMPGLVEFAKH